MSETNETGKRFGWFIAKPDGKTDIGRSTKEFSADNWAEFESIVAVTSELRPFVIDFISLERDFSVLQAVEDEIADEMLSAANFMTITGVQQTLFLAKAQGALTNFLGAASAFRDRSLTRLRERYGEESLEYKMFFAVTRDAYEHSFAYRLLYNLRNYAQHHDNPISFIPTEGRNLAEREQAEITVRLMLKPNELLESSRINKTFRTTELVNHKEPIEIVPMAAEYMQWLGALMKAVVEPQVYRLEELQRYGKMILRVMKLPKGALPVILEGEIPNTRFYHFSFDELGFLHGLYVRLGGIQPESPANVTSASQENSRP